MGFNLLSTGFLILTSSLLVFGTDSKNLLCSNSNEKYHNESSKCFPIGEKGPCGNMMIFYAHPHESQIGYCDCDISLRCNRPLLYWPLTDQCYYAFDQGPCEDQDWFVLDRFKEPTCQRNPCHESSASAPSNSESLDNSSDNEYMVFSRKDGKCYKTGSQGPCPHPNEILVVNGFSAWNPLEPKCSLVRYSCQLPLNGSLTAFCRDGQKLSVTEHCGHIPIRHHRVRGGGRHHGKRHLKHWRGRRSTRAQPIRGNHGQSTGGGNGDRIELIGGGNNGGHTHGGNTGGGGGWGNSGGSTGRGKGGRTG